MSRLQYSVLRRLVKLFRWPGRSPLGRLLDQAAPLDLRILGRTLLHAALVGIAAGLAGAILFVGLEHFQRLVLEVLVGYTPLRADGETFHVSDEPRVFRPWLLVLAPALGGLACGLVTLLAPEVRGGGGDAMIEAFHRGGGSIRPRVIVVKALASMFTLGTGGAGGREGPTMQIGGALGSLVARMLSVSVRERRILMIAGVAAGISAVFRTPLGAALLAVEVLYKDGFESEALIPSVLASVVSYSVTTTLGGQGTLFTRVPRFPFHPEQLLLYLLLALVVAALAVVFLEVYGSVKGFFYKLPIPAWSQPGLGGLMLGVFATPLVWAVGVHIHQPGQGLGLLGGGYGAVQMAIAGSEFLPEGWTAVVLLLLLAIAKLIAASITIGSGGSAGDFAPSLAIGGLVGGAFGRAAQILLQDPRIIPGAFALVGMGAFYGGIAHVPLSALVLVCELAGNYDLLVPLMLTQGIAFVALRQRALYHAQVATQRESSAHRDHLLLSFLETLQVRAVVNEQARPVCFHRETPLSEMVQHLTHSGQQDVFPVVDSDNKLAGLVTSSTIHVALGEMADAAWVLAADVMQADVSVTFDDDLRTASERLVSNELREVPVIGRDRQVVCMLKETDIARLYVSAAARADVDRRAVRRGRGA
ncbi:MAG TPA: chloride channel protein [Polyangiaceae bacterium]|nr:chloride channel protein [Polyangiaceae bacterium]